MSKEQFIIAYVLNRARGHTGGLEALSAVREAIKAWNAIRLEVAKVSQ